MQRAVRKDFNSRAEFLSLQTENVSLDLGVELKTWKIIEI